MQEIYRIDIPEKTDSINDKQQSIQEPGFAITSTNDSALYELAIPK